MAKRKKPRTPFLNPNFAAAVQSFGAEMLVTQNISHRPGKGTTREDVLRKYFKERLPSRYSVGTGEIVDLFGRTSPQMDLMFFDSSRDFSFSTSSFDVLPAEAVLATVEVKSTLNSGQIAKCIESAKRLRELKPFGKRLAGADINEEDSTNRGARYFHAVFAYETNLGADDWMANEFRRFAAKNPKGSHLIDCVYVLNRGYLSLSNRSGRLEDGDGGAISTFFFSILNFLQREGRRRGNTPFERYTAPKKNSWQRL